MIGTAGEAWAGSDGFGVDDGDAWGIAVPTAVASRRPARVSVEGRIKRCGPGMVT